MEVLTCDQPIVQNGTYVECPGTWSLQQFDGSGFTLEDLSSETMAAAYAAGFVLVGTAYVIGFSFRIILGMIRSEV